jgi:pre-rRNA-processing protein IPI3
LKLSTPKTRVRSALEFPLRMLTESLVASVLTREGNAKAPTSRDASIHFFDLKPRFAVRSAFKRSSTQANCLAVGSSHIYAAQADKAVVHVYSRERNNQEAVVPFPERIHSVALSNEAEGAATLILGTEGGRLILWEVRTCGDRYTIQMD